MFPQLVAGPIVRYVDIKKSITSRVTCFADFEYGVRRFSVGLIKKVLVADYLGQCADKIFHLVEFQQVSMVTAWVGAIAYTYEIYYDFSGYSDMAIGIGRCLGFKFEENFNYPYVAKSVSDFWKRWHISLTKWFKDYVYIPLGGNRVSKARHILNLLIVWLLTGFWHGANWTFLLWGGMYFVVLLFEKKTTIINKLPSCLGKVYTMVIVVIGWVLFKSPNIHVATTFLKDMVGINGIVDSNSALVAKSVCVIGIIAILFSYPVVTIVKTKMEQASKQSLKRVFEVIIDILIVLLYIYSLFVILNGSYSPFIYFNF
ncbi:MAG: MBOAT family protein [Lachnospiraceae bacterium]|nr:MBOAT family protein [Lachnospiraceae bacterium]